MFLSYGGDVPAVGERVHVDDSARVIGDVRLHDDVTILPCAVVRAEAGPIVVGCQSAIEDGCVLHAESEGLELGERVVLGHGAIVHCRSVGSDTLVGMGAVVLAGAVVGAGCLIAAGSVVTQGMQVPAGSLVMGVPARVVRPVSPEQRAYIAMASEYYRGWGEACRSGMVREVVPRPLGADAPGARAGHCPS